MDKLDEFERYCGLARESVRKFLRMSPEERDLMQDAKKIEVALAFQHIEMCWWGGPMPDLCNHLWQDLQPMTRDKKEDGLPNEAYDPQVAKYLLFARFPLQNFEGTEDNPLKKLLAPPPHTSWPQQKAGIDY